MGGGPSPNSQVLLPLAHPSPRLETLLTQGGLFSHLMPRGYSGTTFPCGRVTPDLIPRLKALAESRLGTWVSSSNPGLCPQSTPAFQQAETTIQDKLVFQDLGQGEP